MPGGSARAAAQRAGDAAHALARRHRRGSVRGEGGSMARVGEHLIAGVREVVYSRSAPLATAHLSIVQSATGAEAGVLGASILAVEHTLSRDVLAAGVETV